MYVSNLDSVLQPLERLRNEILFELTALELQKEPWIEMLNQSLSHLKTTQFFINSDSADICYNRSTLFKEKLKNHLIENQRNILNALNDRLAPCRPLFDIFDANRHLLCYHIVGSMNGVWLSSFLSIVLWTILTPISLRISSIYKRMDKSREMLQSNSHQ